MARTAPDLEFLPRSPWARWWPRGVLALGVLACLTVALRYRQASDEARDSAAARLQAPSAATAGAAPSRESAAEVAEAQAVAAALAVPWEAWFRALESVSVPGVVLTALQPEGGRRRARISGQAAELSLALAYMERLEHASGFRRVLLVDHAMEDGPPPRVRFTLTADWGTP